LHNDWQFRRCGEHSGLNPPYTVPRFQCLHCKRTFSSQTFSTTYWLKRPDLLPKIFHATVNGMANRQIALAFHCAPSTVNHLLARLGRHCLLFQRHFCLDETPPGDIAIDGLVSYVLAKRLFVTHISLGERWSDYYWRRVRTVALPVNRRHRLFYAF
jgi:hypothetical protein